MFDIGFGCGHKSKQSAIHKSTFSFPQHARITKCALRRHQNLSHALLMKKFSRKSYFLSQSFLWNPVRCLPTVERHFYLYERPIFYSLQDRNSFIAWEPFFTEKKEVFSACYWNKTFYCAQLMHTRIFHLRKNVKKTKRKLFQLWNIYSSTTYFSTLNDFMNDFMRNYQLFRFRSQTVDLSWYESELG